VKTLPAVFTQLEFPERLFRECRIFIVRVNRNTSYPLGRKIGRHKLIVLRLFLVRFDNAKFTGFLEA
jgi:hypothetical protein